MSQLGWRRRTALSVAGLLGIVAGLAAKMLPLATGLVSLGFLFVLVWLSSTGRIRYVSELTAEGRKNIRTSLWIVLVAACVVFLVCLLAPIERLLVEIRAMR